MYFVPWLNGRGLSATRLDNCWLEGCGNSSCSIDLRHLLPGVRGGGTQPGAPHHRLAIDRRPELVVVMMMMMMVVVVLLLLQEVLVEVRVMILHAYLRVTQAEADCAVRRLRTVRLLV